MEAKPNAARPVRRTLLVCFSLYHLAAITLGNVPETTALGGTLHRPFSAYLTLLSLRQTWDMFTTIPHFLAMTGELVTKDATGVVRREGPLLPGLRAYEDDSRVHVTFMRLAFSAPAYPGYPESYLAAVCRALSTRSPAARESVGFELRVMQLRPLADVRRDRQIAEPKTFSFGPASCAR